MNLHSYLQFMRGTLDNGISFCVHDFVGMASGEFEGDTLPLTPLELELQGATPPTPPDPEPPPPDPEPPAPITVSVSDPDSSGSYNLQIKFNAPTLVDHVDLELAVPSDSPSNSATPEPDDEPPPSIDSTLYVNMQRVPYLIRTLHTDMQIWAGVRDPQYTAVHCKDRIEEVFGISPDEMLQLASAYEDLITEGQHLIADLPKEHPHYPGRSRVRKDRLKDFRTRLDAANATAESWRVRVESEPGAGIPGGDTLMSTIGKDQWFKLFIIVLGLLISVVSAAGGYVYSQLADDIAAGAAKFEHHTEAQFQNELITAERLGRIEAILEDIRDELQRTRP
jgi:PAS domain-containing protein